MIESTDVLWDSQLTGMSGSFPEPSEVLYTCILSALPRCYDGLVYKKTELPAQYSSFLTDANGAPVLRIAAIIGVLSKLATDESVSDDLRNKIDRGKTDTLFWQIIGQEKSIDAKTESGTGWTSKNTFMASLPAQMQRILDDCHFFSNMLKWKEAQSFQIDDLVKVEKSYQELLDRFNDPFYAQDLYQKLAAGISAADMQKIIYILFIKLGLIERIIWKRKIPEGTAWLGASDSVMDTESADNWAIKELVDPIPRTRASVEKLCEQLVNMSHGTLDDTTRAQIREIPRKLTGSIGGINIIKGIPLLQQFLNTIVTLQRGGILGVVLAPLFEERQMTEAEGRQHTEAFIKDQGLIVQCLKS